MLLNNLAVALANQGQIEEAIDTVQQIREVPEELRATLLATEGLLRFRRGDMVEGRRLYLEAVERARRRSDRRSEALAIAHLAKEEMVVGADTAEETLATAEKASVGIDLLEIPHLLKLIRGLRTERR